jgi:hypothetical protein
MRLFKLIGVVLLSASFGACASSTDPNYRLFGKNAAMREVSGLVIKTGKNWWGQRYVVVKDEATGMRIYVQSDAQTCTPGKSFRGSGHLSRADEKEYEATFHFHLSKPDRACG